MINVGSERIANLLPNSLIVTRDKRDAPTLYLTFDDGPDPEITPLLINLLKQHDIHASFFCIGKNIESYPEIVEQLVAAGHFVANHSENHKDLTKLNAKAQQAEIEQCQNRLEMLCPNPAKIFRAPRGRLGPLSLLRFRREGWTPVHWSFDSLDHEKKILDKHLKYLIDKPPSRGDILLFHDDDIVAIEILTVMLPEWIAQGFSFATVDDLLRKEVPARGVN